MYYSLSDCRALITGASAGLGREFARHLAPSARLLILVARRQDRLEELRKELDRPGLEIRCCAVDIADDAALGAFLEEMRTLPQPIDLLVNNAGLGDHGYFDESEWKRVAPMLDVNIHALTRITHALLPRMISARKGAILNVSSIASLLPLPKMAVYAATKSYVTSFTEGIRAELKGTGVTVTAVCPGPVDTEFRSVAKRGEVDDVPAPDVFKIPAARVAREALAAVERNQARLIPGWLVFLVMTITSLVPIFILRLFLAKRRG